MLTLHQFAGSPYCWKVRIVLAEKGVAYRPMTPQDRDRDPEFQRMTPVGKVPVLQLEDGQCLIESTIINEYLEERFPQPPLLPGTAEERARARTIEEIADAYLAPALRLAFTARYRHGAGRVVRLRQPNAQQEAEGRRTAARYLDHLQTTLADREWFGGRFSLADVGVIPPLTRSARMLEVPLRDRWPALAAWAERALARPSVASTAPPPYEIVDEEL